MNLLDPNAEFVHPGCLLIDQGVVESKEEAGDFLATHPEEVYVFYWRHYEPSKIARWFGREESSKVYMLYRYHSDSNGNTQPGADHEGNYEMDRFRLYVKSDENGGVLYRFVGKNPQFPCLSDAIIDFMRTL